MNIVETTKRPWARNGHLLIQNEARGGVAGYAIAHFIEAMDAEYARLAVNTHEDLIMALTKANEFIRTARGLYDESRPAYKAMTNAIELNEAVLTAARGES